MLHMCAESRTVCQIPSNWTYSYSYVMWMLELNFGSLQEQCIQMLKQLSIP